MNDKALGYLRLAVAAGAVVKGLDLIEKKSGLCLILLRGDGSERTARGCRRIADERHIPLLTFDTLLPEYPGCKALAVTNAGLAAALQRTLL
ncbi:MAG: hypothetical protein LBM78_00735 [Clostridiales bacterium]|jgi:hypothetical protein|nr:hypothetical protein [Clostridiales bacterium]